MSNEPSTKRQAPGLSPGGSATFTILDFIDRLDKLLQINNFGSYERGIVRSCGFRIEAEHFANDPPNPVDSAREVQTGDGYWRCRCGAVAFPLTDDTACRCEDLYDQEWSFVPLPLLAAARGNSGGEE